jgi:pimeloyl-ACP methyl ester carboxylesterase
MKPPAPPVARDHDVAFNGHRLFAREWLSPQANTKPPIVLLHDSLGSVELWRDFPEALCAAVGRRVIAYDRLGFGKSDAYPGAIALDFVATEWSGGLAAVLAALNVDDFILFGHSVGGDMSVIAAAELAAHCKGLITESAQAFAEDITLDGVRRARTLFADPAQMRRLKKYHGEKAPWVVSSWIDSWLSPDFADWTLAPWLAKVTCPVLALHGDADEYGSHKHPEMIGALAAGPSDVRILANCGHVPHREQQQAVLEAVGLFLA